MEAPECIVCGTRHWHRQPCPALKTDTKPEVKLVANRVEIAPRPMANKPAAMANSMANIPQSMANTDQCMANMSPSHVANTYKYRDREQRKAYMRQLMAAKRATKKQISLQP